MGCLAVGYAMQVVLVILLVVLFLAGAGIGIAYKSSHDFSETVDSLFLKKEVPGTPEPGTPEPGKPVGQSTVATGQVASTGSVAAQQPGTAKPTFLSFRHDPDKPPVPQPIEMELEKVPLEVEKAISAKYPFPTFPSLHEAVKNWSNIPGKIFPLDVNVQKELVFKVTGDDKGDKLPITIPAGGGVVAMRQEGSMLYVLQGRTSRYEARVPLFQTNIRDVVSELYNLNVNAWFRLTYKLRNDARARYNAGLPAFAGGPAPTAVLASNTPKGTPSTSTQPSNKPGGPVDPVYGATPGTNSKGEVTCVANDIRANKFKDCQYQFIQRWGVPKKGRFKGKPLWVVEVGYQVDSIFGRFPQEARFYIRNERVEDWEVIDD
jgi:hypothetical protein